MTALPSLPITDVLDDIKQGIAQHQQLVLEAPPGAGKTTLVPLALLSAEWLGQQRIIMLEPRRMAARSAAQRMASLLGEPVGQTVGYRVRQETKVSKQTRIEVITEGILTRMLLQDPSLDGVGLLIFDEFHERSIDADFGLALALQGREIFRDADTPLRLMVMSATLDGDTIASLLTTDNDTVPIIRSQGKMFPVDILYGKAKRYDENIIERVSQAAISALQQHSGSQLVFLPGQGEINKVLQRLKRHLADNGITDTVVLPLYGALPFREQQRAIEPLAKDGPQRKIVLATDIAETSLTIEGINVVIDAGLCREPCFDPATGMTRLQTRRISQDSSVQRMGRAGRLTEGVCYRLWSEEQQQQLPRQSTPQILQADLAPLLLQILVWGIDDIHELHWLDAPPSGPLSQARDLLHSLGAISGTTISTEQPLQGWTLTPHGEQMAAMPTHPRLAHMLISSAGFNLSKQACALAAVLADRHPLSRDYGADLAAVVATVSGERACHSQHQAWLKRTQQQAKTFQQLLNKYHRQPTQTAPLKEQQQTGFLLASAYPDRIARKKTGSHNNYQLSNGRAATLDNADKLSNHTWLAVAELGGSVNHVGQKSTDRIYSACEFDAELFQQALAPLTTEKTTLEWDDSVERFIAEQVTAVGKLAIKSQRIEKIPAEEKRQALLALIQKRGLSLLPWDKPTRQWQARVELLRQHHSGKQEWPNVSDQHLLNTLELWLAPYLENINKLGDFKKIKLQEVLSHLLPWPLPQQLNELAPIKISVPSGSQISIDYSQNPPVLSVKLQEMFGCADTPSIANGQIKLMLHLLSPAQRPLQVTQDLAGFWSSSYFEVQKEMKGRYPKHPWPDKPQEAAATKYTKHRPKK
ncbi:ATP-dependent helicase HrpB [Oceanicoccus sagamiensis]|uniref:ATP-dependent helicase HrpB n=1 Tax=Oceanicoccus sagamiensis TaxID=716816 RepID=A0A1X9NFH1_9GAMM|nr:ATP-dependent helicase HrpB [Oceanicoccus sagamiensis]ARN72763.1 ATP-dependent helicase HrpB [Oceanicoccus sagamiensis]